MQILWQTLDFLAAKITLTVKSMFTLFRYQDAVQQPLYMTGFIIKFITVFKILISYRIITLFHLH